MITAHYLVTVHLNIDLPLALLQPEPADAPYRPGAGGPCLPGLRKLRRVREVPA